MNEQVLSHDTIFRQPESKILLQKILLMQPMYRLEKLDEYRQTMLFALSLRAFQAA